MKLKSNDGVVSYHFFLTPQGWSLTAFTLDQFYEPKKGCRYLDALARKLKDNNAGYFKPLFAIDYIGDGLINIVAGEEVSQDDLRKLLSDRLAELDREFDLGLLPLVRSTLCTNFLNGINWTRSTNVVCENSALVPKTISQHALS